MLVVLYTLMMTLEFFIYFLFVSPILNVNLDYYDFEYHYSESDEAMDFDDDEDMSPPLNSTPSNPEPSPDHTPPSMTGNLKSHSYLLGLFFSSRCFSFFARGNQREHPCILPGGRDGGCDPFLPGRHPR